MIRWYSLLVVIMPLTFLDAPTRIVSFSAPPENILHEPFNLVLNISHLAHRVDEPAGVVGFLLQIPKDWEVQRVTRATLGTLEVLRRYENLESFFQPEPGYQSFGVSLLDLPSETDDVLWKIMVTVVPRSVGSYPLKVISCSQSDSEAGYGWKVCDPADFAGFRRLESGKFVEVVSVRSPQYNGGQAVSLRQNGDAIHIGPVEGPFFVPEEDFTVEFWLKTTSLDGGILTVTGASLDDPSPGGIYLEIDPEGMPVLTVGEGDSAKSLMADVTIADGTWHHLSLAHRASSKSLLLHVDGRLTDSLTVSRFSKIQPVSLTMGALVREGFVGMIDEFRVWSVARTADQVRHDMIRVLESATAGLIGLYHLDELSGANAANELRVGLPGATLHGEARFVASHSPAVPEVFRFSAQLRGSEIELTWVLSSIEGVDEFIVERRREGEPFEEAARIDVLESKGGMSPHTFTYVDRVLTDVGVVRYRIRQNNVDGSLRYSDEVKVGAGKPVEFTLEQNHPNPFNPSTTITYMLHVETQVRLKVYDLVGREIGVLVDQRQGPGTYAIDFDAENYKGLTSGIYFYKLETERQSEIRKMILAK